MRSIWKGSISFGLVTIPIAVFPATSAREKISFNMLRKGDLSPIKLKRVAEVDGKEVAWEDIVKGYQYEKGQYVVFEEKDFESVELNSTQTIAIQDFVPADQINPIYYDTPYYLEPQKGGNSAYALLREVLGETQKVGIAKVALRNREHLAAVRAEGNVLMLELMRFSHEIAPAEELRVSTDKPVGEREKQMAKSLLEHMTTDWEPEKYKDEYADAVMKVIEKKIAAGGQALPAAKTSAPRSTNVIDLIATLQESLAATKKGKTDTGAKKKKKASSSSRAA